MMCADCGRCGSVAETANQLRLAFRPAANTDSGGPKASDPPSVTEVGDAVVGFRPRRASGREGQT